MRGNKGREVELMKGEERRDWNNEGESRKKVVCV